MIKRYTNRHILLYYYYYYCHNECNAERGPPFILFQLQYAVLVYSTVRQHIHPYVHMTSVTRHARCQLHLP